MSKLSDIVFQPIVSKEFEIKGHKIFLRTLSTKDIIDLNFGVDDNKLDNSSNILKFSLKILSKSVVSIDGIFPENENDVIDFVNKQTPEMVLEIFTRYQGMSEIKEEEIKK